MVKSRDCGSAFPILLILMVRVGNLNDIAEARLRRVEAFCSERRVVRAIPLPDGFLLDSVSLGYERVQPEFASLHQILRPLTSQAVKTLRFAPPQFASVRSYP